MVSTSSLKFLLKFSLFPPQTFQITKLVSRFILSFRLMGCHSPSLEPQNRNSSLGWGPISSHVVPLLGLEVALYLSSTCTVPSDSWVFASDLASPWREILLLRWGLRTPPMMVGWGWAPLVLPSLALLARVLVRMELGEVVGVTEPSEEHFGFGLLHDLHAHPIAWILDWGLSPLSMETNRDSVRGRYFGWSGTKWCGKFH